MRDRLRYLVLNTIAPIFWLPHGLRRAIYRRCGLRIGDDSFLFAHQTVRLGDIRIGDHCFVNYGGLFDPGEASIVIDDDVFIGVQVVLAAQSHEVGARRRRAGASFSEPIHIGHGCWLGARVTVLPGVTIAPGCIIAAGAVVTRDTSPDGVYAGVPARRIRDLT